MLKVSGSPAVTIMDSSLHTAGRWTRRQKSQQCEGQRCPVSTLRGGLKFSKPSVRFYVVKALKASGLAAWICRRTVRAFTAG